MLSARLILELERQRADLHSTIINAHGNLLAPDVLAASAALDKVIVLMQTQLGQRQRQSPVEPNQLAVGFTN